MEGKLTARQDAHEARTELSVAKAVADFGKEFRKDLQDGLAEGRKDLQDGLAEGRKDLQDGLAEARKARDDDRAEARAARRWGAGLFVLGFLGLAGLMLQLAGAFTPA